ncbi:protein-glutamine gamma-glutamyltransferase [Paenibacillus hodogayensis]|uniref:Protein-glutamine gamma-glutamyltransferase n=1 Tax=Paenibacillus hodogayensis TaxID=279208 RepID=A0ABV5W8G6_9BACL
MITVGQGAIRPDLLSGTERVIYEQKMGSSTPFHYETADELLFELKLRAATVAAAIALEHSEVAFATFKKSRANNNYWRRTNEGGFELRKRASPSAAIRDIYANGGEYGFECATAIVIVLYKAVLDTIGDETFDRLFGNLYLYSWEHDSDMPLVTEDGKRETFPGDVLYYINPDYNPETPQWQGENVVKLTGDMLFGHGIGIKNERGIIDELNENRRPGSQISARLFERTTHPDYSAILQETQVRSGTSGPAFARSWPAGAIAGRIGRRTRVYG